MESNLAANGRAQNNPETELKLSIENFEESLLTPLISGDVPKWAEDVRTTWAVACGHIHHHLARLHPRQYEEMAGRDPELLPRIELLRQEDLQLERQRGDIDQMISRLDERASQLEPDEAKAARHAEKLVAAGVQFLAGMRKQRVAVQTWFAEAFTRDRGAVD